MLLQIILIFLSNFTEIFWFFPPLNFVVVQLFSLRKKNWKYCHLGDSIRTGLTRFGWKYSMLTDDCHSDEIYILIPTSPQAQIRAGVLTEHEVEEEESEGMIMSHLTDLSTHTLEANFCQMLNLSNLPLGEVFPYKFWKYSEAVYLASGADFQISMPDFVQPRPS